MHNPQIKLHTMFLNCPATDTTEFPALKKNTEAEQCLLSLVQELSPPPPPPQTSAISPMNHPGNVFPRPRILSLTLSESPVTMYSIPHTGDFLHCAHFLHTRDSSHSPRSSLSLPGHSPQGRTELQIKLHTHFVSKTSQSHILDL